MKSSSIFFGVIILIYVAYRVYKYQTLDEGLDKLIKNGAVILDVQTEKDFEMGHIAGSQNISLETIRERYTELNPEKTYITVYSHVLRSVKVENILKEKGFKKVHNGGAWSDLEKSLNLK